MPILYQPGAPTVFPTTPTIPPTLPTYTLIVIATEDIGLGVVFQFQTWNGFDFTYVDTPDNLFAEFWLTTTSTIPAGTPIVVKMTTTETQLLSTVGGSLSTVGAGITNVSISNVSTSRFNVLGSLVAFAYVPSCSGGLFPSNTRGQPMFAIGFSNTGVCFEIAPASTTAPNFPDQFSGITNPFIFLYSVVYPGYALSGSPPACAITGRIAYRQFFAGIEPSYIPVPGSWLSAREIISQPGTVLGNAIGSSITNWVPYTLYNNIGPFRYVLQEGQLAVVYFRPRPADFTVLDTPASAYVWDQRSVNPATPSAQIAVLVTSPIPPLTLVPITLLGYNSQYSGFGSIIPPAWNTPSPTYNWTTGSVVIPAGTVLLFTGIGADPTPVAVQDAHGLVTDVGSVQSGGDPNPNCAVVSVSFLAFWAQGFDQRFIAAALSNQYVGDFPTLSVDLTIRRVPFSVPAVYAPGQTFKNTGLPGTVQTAMINGGFFTEPASAWQTDALALPTSVNYVAMPTFTGMTTFFL